MIYLRINKGLTEGGERLKIKDYPKTPSHSFGDVLEQFAPGGSALNAIDGRIIADVLNVLRQSEDFSLRDILTKRRSYSANVYVPDANGILVKKNFEILKNVNSASDNHICELRIKLLDSEMRSVSYNFNLIRGEGLLLTFTFLKNKYENSEMVRPRDNLSVYEYDPLTSFVKRAEAQFDTDELCNYLEEA